MALRLLKLILLVLVNFGHPSVAQVDDASQIETAGENPPQAVETEEPFVNDQFRVACQDRHDVRDTPTTGLLRRRVPTQDNQGVLTRDFLTSVIQNLVVYADQSANMADNVDFCLQDSSRHPTERVTGSDCEAWNTWATGALVEHTRRARYHLSIAQNAFDRDWRLSSRLTVSYEPNTELSVSRDSHKEVPWDSLTRNETQRASEVLERYRQHVWTSNNVTAETLEWRNRAHARRTRPIRQTISREMRYLRNEHMNRYHNLVSEVPLLQYLHSSNPSSSEIRSAAQRVRTLAENEVQRLIQLLKELESLGPGDRIPPKFLDVLSFQAFTEGTLLTNPEYCSIATALSQTRQNRRTGNALGIALPLFAVGLFASPIVAVGVGVGATVPLAATARARYQRAREQRLAQIISHYEGSSGNEQVDRQNPFAGSALNELVTARQEYNTELLLAPSSLVGAGIVRGTVRMARGAIPAGTASAMSTAGQRAGGLMESTTRSSWLNLTRTRIRNNH